MRALRRLARGIAFIARGAISSVAGNVGLAVLALALALSLWLYVTDKENPTQEQVFNSAIAINFINVPNELAVANASASTVRIRIEAPKSELDSLTTDDFEATVNLGGFEPGKQDVSVDVTTPNRRIDIVDITPARLDVTLESLTTKEVPVRVDMVGSPQDGFAAAGDEQVEPGRVTVSGAQSLVELVDSVRAEVILAGKTVDLDERVRLQPRDARGGLIGRVTVNPDLARVRVDIEQREYSLEFTVTPRIAGAPPAGFNVAAISVEPRIVLVTGPLDVLQSRAVEGIATDEISLADSRDDVVRTVDLDLPDGLRVQGSTSVRVTIDIRAEQGEFSFRVVADVLNLGDGLAATSAEPITVRLTGDVAVLQSISPESIAATVDAQGLGEGLFALPLQVVPPPGTAVSSIEPPQLGVAIAVRS